MSFPFNFHVFPTFLSAPDCSMQHRMQHANHTLFAPVMVTSEDASTDDEDLVKASTEVMLPAYIWSPLL